MIIDWMIEHIVAITVAILLLLAALVALSIATEAEARKAFMEECLKDKKQYECTAMWRAGDLHSQVVPMPIIMPSSR